MMIFCSLGLKPTEIADVIQLPPSLGAIAMEES